ncbi:hypothetical protein M728_005460 (plasmid) [Ensifer sp. WSM1721]
MSSLRQTACYGNTDVGKSGNTFRLVPRRPRAYPTAAVAAMAVSTPYSRRTRRGTPRLVHLQLMFRVQFQVDPCNSLQKVIVCK